MTTVASEVANTIRKQEVTDMKYAVIMVDASQWVIDAGSADEAAQEAIDRPTPLDKTYGVDIEELLGVTMPSYGFAAGANWLKQETEWLESQLKAAGWVEEDSGMGYAHGILAIFAEPTQGVSGAKQ